MDISTLRYISELDREVKAANVMADVANTTVADLAQVVRRQHGVIRDLSVALTVLSQMLVDANVIDGNALVERIEAGIAEQKEVPPQVRCSECRQEVPMARTDIRASGPVCDACVAKGK